MAIPSFLAARQRLKPLSSKRRAGGSTPCSGRSMPRSRIDVSRRASPAGSRRRWPSYRRSRLDNSTISLIASPLRRVLVQKTKNVIDPAANADAALSQTLPQHCEKLAAGEFHAVDQPHQHPYVGQHRRTRQGRLVEHDRLQPQLRRRFVGTRLVGRRLLSKSRRRFQIRRRHGRGHLPARAAGIATLLRAVPLRPAIIRAAPPVSTLPAVLPPATERTTQVSPAGVAGVGQEANPTVHAANDASLKFGMGLHGRVYGRLILPDKRLGAIVLMPIRAEGENFLQRDKKNAKLSVIIWMLCTSSSYLIAANATRGRAKFFYAPRRRILKSRRHEPSTPYRSPEPLSLPSRHRSTARHVLRSLLERRNPLLLSK